MKIIDLDTIEQCFGVQRGLGPLQPRYVLQGPHTPTHDPAADHRRYKEWLFGAIKAHDADVVYELKHLLRRDAELRISGRELHIGYCGTAAKPYAAILLACLEWIVRDGYAPLRTPVKEEIK